MSSSPLTNMGKQATCVFCEKPVPFLESGTAAESHVAILLTPIYRAVEPDDNEQIDPGDTIVDLDWSDECFAHRRCFTIHTGVKFGGTR